MVFVLDLGHGQEALKSPVDSRACGGAFESFVLRSNARNGVDKKEKRKKFNHQRDEFLVKFLTG